MHGIIIVFDVTKEESFENINMWLQAIDQHSDQNVKKLLIGNKSDLTYDRVVGHTRAKVSKTYREIQQVIAFLLLRNSLIH